MLAFFPSHAGILSSSLRPKNPRFKVRACASTNGQSPPSWAVPLEVRPGESKPQRDVQWENFKKHVGNWVGQWTYYTAAGGPATKSVRSVRRLVVHDGEPETVVQTNVTREREGDAPKEENYLYTGTNPPRWVQSIRADGSIGPSVPGIFEFAPQGHGAWLNATIGKAGSTYFCERYLLHPHINGIRISVGAVINMVGVQMLWYVRETDVPGCGVDSSPPDKGVYSSASEAPVLQDGAVRSDPHKGQYCVVEHSMSSELVLSGRQYAAEAAPTVPFGTGHVSLQFPDGVDVSFPAVSDQTVLGSPSQLHVRWQIDRGAWLHARSTYDEKGCFSDDTVAIYYPV